MFREIDFWLLLVVRINIFLTTVCFLYVFFTHSRKNVTHSESKNLNVDTSEIWREAERYKKGDVILYHYDTHTYDDQIIRYFIPARVTKIIYHDNFFKPLNLKPRAGTWDNTLLLIVLLELLECKNKLLPQFTPLIDPQKQVEQLLKKRRRKLQLTIDLSRHGQGTTYWNRGTRGGSSSDECLNWTKLVECRNRILDLLTQFFSQDVAELTLDYNWPNPRVLDKLGVGPKKYAVGKFDIEYYSSYPPITVETNWEKCAHLWNE